MTRRLSKLEKFGLIAALITGMLYYYLTNVYDPQQKALIQAQERLNHSIRELNQLQASEPIFQLRRRLDSRKESLAGLEQEMKGMNVNFGTEADPVAAQHSVYRLMERLNIRVLNVTPAGRHDELFTWHVYRLSIECDFASFIAFLHGLRTHSSPLRVHRVNINGDAAGWPLKISLDLWM